MKKNCFGIALLFLLFSPAVFAQSILFEDFQQGIPNTWTLIDNDGRTPDSTQTDFVTEAWVSWQNPLDANDLIAVSTSKYLPAGQADDWLITPSISLGSSSLLTWNAVAFQAAADGYEVRISTTTPTINGFLANPPLFATGAENVAWTKHSANLTAYPNQTVYLAFRNNSTNKFILGIDDILVFDCIGLPAEAGTIDTGTTIACAGYSALDLELPPSYTGSTPTNTISGNTNDIPSWNPLPGRPFEDGGCCETFENPPYQVVGFQVTTSGNYNIRQVQSGFDGMFFIYTDPFDLSIQVPDFPSGFIAGSTFIAGNDDSAFVAGPPFISYVGGLTLTQGQNYYLVSTAFYTIDFGNYTTTFSGPGSLLLVDPNAADLPYDYNYVVTNSNGVIVSIGADLTNTSTFPGSLAGDTFSVCGISYMTANINLSAYIGLPKSVLENDISANSCAAFTNDCHTAVILSGGSVDAGTGDTLCAGGTVTLNASGAVSYVWSTGDSTATIQVTPLYTTTYSVTATDNIGCTATDDVTVKLYSSDGGKFEPGPTLACIGDPALNFSLELEFFRNFFPTQTNQISGNTVNFLTWDTLPGRPFTDGTCCTGFNTVYDVKPFQIDQTGLYYFYQTQLGFDGIMYLYTDPFNLQANPPVSFIAANDDSALVSGVSYLDSIQLDASKTYYLVSTGFNAGQYGNYITDVWGAGNLLLPGQPDTTQFGFEYLTVDSAGIIVAFSQDLSDSTVYPGSAAGNEYQVCAVSYLIDSVNISPYLGQPFSSLDNAGCLDPSDNCHSVKIFTPPVANAGADQFACFNDTITMAGNAPAAGQGRWNTITGTGIFLNTANPSSRVFNLSAGLNVLTWTIDNGGCEDTDTMEVIVQLPVANAGGNDTLCRLESSTLTATGGVSYVWSNNQTTASINVTPLSTTTYTVTVTDGDGCTASDNVTVIVNQPPAVSILNATICPGSTTILDAENPGAAYIWSTGATSQTITVSTAGVSCVTVTDANGCTNSDCAVVSIGSGLTVILDDVTLCEGDSVTFNAGNPGANYTWSTGETSQIIKAGDSGVYSVSVVDANNCSGFDSATVTIVQLPPLSAGIDTSICEGDNVTLIASGAGTFEWSTGETTTSITVSPTQDETYSVTLTGGNGCTVSDEVAVTVVPLPNFDLGSNFSICEGESVTLSAAGGTQYLWNTGDTSADITVSPASTTTYSVTATSGSNCSVSDSVTISVKALPIADAGANDTICEGESATLSASGGGSYLWENGNANSTITVFPIENQTYSVTVTAANGCTDSDSVFVEVNPLPSVDLGDAIDYCSGTLLTLSASGGDFYLWSTGDTTEYIDVTPSSDETYCVTATTNAGCVASDCVDVFVRPNVIADAGPDTTICEGISIDLNATGGTDYEWNNGSNSAQTTVSPTETTIYSVTVSNAFGCEDIDEVTVTVNDAPDVTLFGFDTTFYCLNHAPIVVAGSPTGGNLSGPGINNNGQFVPSDAGLGTHVITYSLEGNNDCIGSDSDTITVDACIGIASVQDALKIEIYPNPADAFVFVEVEGLRDDTGELQIYDPIGRLLLSEKITDGKKQLDISSLATGSYLLQIKHQNGIYLRQLIRNY